MYIKWNNNFSIGIGLIDDQHKKLLDILNELYESHKMGTGQQDIQDIINRLLDYTIYHFSNEEQLFKEYQYPHSSEHIDQHNEFTTQAKMFQDKCQSGNLILSMKILDYLKDWTINHVLGSDKEFGAYLLSKELSRENLKEVLNIEGDY